MARRPMVAETWEGCFGTWCDIESERRAWDTLAIKGDNKLCCTDLLCTDMCIDMYMDICIDMCTDMCTDMHMDLYMDMCIGMHMGMCMCTDTCIDLWIECA